MCGGIITGWLGDIGQYIEDKGIGTLGTDIFYEDFETSVSNCITLISQAGMISRTTLQKTSILTRPELGIRIRNQSLNTANTKANEIYKLLDLTFNKLIGDTRFKSIKAVAPPFFVTKTETDLYIYSINFYLEIG